MNLFAWLDENGEWRVAHRPPTDNQSAVLMIALPPGDVPTFIDWNNTMEVEVTV